jgi:hypothetical protein
MLQINNNNNNNNNSKQPLPSQTHHRDAPKVYRLERIAHKNMATENSLYSTTSSIHKGNYSKQTTQKFKLLNLLPRLYILMQKAVILNTRSILRKFLAE